MTLNENSEIVSAQDYYPYGEILRSYTLGSGANNKYYFTEKERDTETNYDYFGARYYDSELARWLQVDPLADKYPGWSPYNYTVNNPLRFIDPDGNQVVQPDPLFNYGFGKGFFNSIKNTVVGLYETVTNPIESGKQILNAITNPGETIDAIGKAVGDWTDKVTSANPMVTGEAAGELAGLVTEALVGAKGISKINSINKVNKAKNAILDYLGDGIELKKNKAGDIILMSKDKKVRFDINNPGNDKSHFHIEKKHNGKWIDAYDEHRIYFKD
jgi:RHS repeat-associated protein